MKKYVGASLIVLGIVLTMSGLNAFDSLGSRLSRLYMGSPLDQSTGLLIAGLCAVMIGVALACFRGERRA